MIKFKKNILQESTFPSGWNFGTFESIKSFIGRKKYCDNLLNKIGQGSGRIVYNVDNQYVLKFAKNQKGIEQNKQEIDFIHDGALGWRKRFFAQIEGADENGLWTISEYCLRPNAMQFKQKIGVSFKEFSKFVFYIRTIENASSWRKPENYETFINETNYGTRLLNAISEVYADYELNISDWGFITSYGINKESNIVIVDYGLSKYVYETYYKPKYKQN